MTNLRPATPGDAPKLASLLGAWVADTTWMPKLHSAEEDQRFLHHLIATQTVWMSDPPDLGFIAFDSAWITHLQVSPTARRKGLGHALVACAQSQTQHLALWTHQANAPAQAFWRAMGFRETARTDGRDSEEKLPDIRFEWTAA